MAFSRQSLVWTFAGLWALVGFANLAQAQDRARQFRNTISSWAGGASGRLGLLLYEQVRKEVELSDEQNDKLRKLGEEMRDKIREQYSGVRNLDAEARRTKFAELRESTAKLREEFEKQMNKVLLPHQMGRLRQIQLQNRLRYSNTVGALTSAEILKELKITEEQKKQLRKVQEEAQKELQEKIKQLREDAQKKVLGVLTTEQRLQWKKMLGEKFELNWSRGRGAGPEPKKKEDKK